VTGEILDAAGLRDTEITPPYGESHQMGTCRMSSDPEAGVVDVDLRVHGTANLYLVGSAVFPAAGCVPPSLTIAALALRLADHLARLPGAV
jgi:choline dehydrogenase-like flavoprotein